MIKLCLASASFLVLLGCSSITTPVDDDYQIGATTSSVLTQYCEENDPIKKAIYSRVIEKKFPNFPLDSVCLNKGE